MAALIGLCVIAAGGAIRWGLKDRYHKRETERRVSSMLATAEHFVDASQDAQAVDLVRVHHSWNQERAKRQICMDPIVWTKDGPKTWQASRGEKTVVIPLAPDAAKP